MKPFLKWAGSKHSIIHHIQRCFPDPTPKRIIEPFMGSGAVFLNTEFDEYVLGDSNPVLINLYQYLVTERQAFIDYIRQWFDDRHNDASQYMALRNEFNGTNDPRLKAALFVYLNRHCFNGLCRFNSAGAFNTSFGRYRKVYFPERELQGFIRAAQQTSVAFYCEDFETNLLRARPGDLVYCDPPYTPLSKTSNFVSYSEGGFSWTAHVNLARHAKRLAGLDIPVIISNHDTPETRSLYEGHGATLTPLRVRRSLAGKATSRGKVGEILAVFGCTPSKPPTTPTIEIPW